ncbi:pyridoxamine 5'-phosphate oxidase family protein [Lysobacter korlensis]|uniref:Pyridoxamine 5'-phosphate oxidase family protein n=1 Tax=Lysobacter korlensis TaxID=553636 RepID=A0ABV6RW85_9GAMM
MTTAADELDHPEAQRMLREAPLLRLGYNGADGTPRVIPIGYLWNGRALVICTATTSPKARALAQRPQVAVSIDEGSTPMDSKAVLIRGTALLETVDGVPEEYIDGARKVMAPEQVPAFEAACAQLYEQMVRITITPAWAKFFDFGAGRLPGFLEQMAHEAQQR